MVGYFLFGFSSLISLIFGVSMLLYFTFITWFGWTQHLARKKLRQASYKVDAIQVENLTNFDTVKFFSQEQREREKYYAAADAYRAIERPYVSRYLLLQIATAVLLGGMMFGCFSVAISDYFAGKMSVGDVASIVALISVLLPGLMLLANEWRNIMKYLTDLEPFFDLLETPNTVIDRPDDVCEKRWNEL